ncbi:baculoviral IAP repeat-containing protein 7-A-like isoform X1 [Mercenaria mercenaria]|uniref:baculoviral IAP repeat-containing protein 7-A-like isoform X1 n=1 Tax=Mercenaria mercenaria TaxID=6596 RepID=UPI00234E511E|nr:baculoviral IAP repeat-containing protein 7-A-like isoform X1 [Mercenaria mercenaria]XP_053396384.1 baculoviral IAP repeat-containing protein 7-A-like isoform X1 [Mercenaria mercenaria]XP_053396385.1 baculoviral IAP repeat-containing protein 7-A-like isoform X1 [Mercenaria mercenaria]
MTGDVKIDSHHSKRPPPIALGINVEKPNFPQYAVYSKRLESFEAWPEYIPVDKIDLVDAGLVYTGVGDSVRCYFCGGGLRNWEYGVVPMEEHAKWYPKCPHILLVKGQAYTERLSRGEKPEIDGSSGNVYLDTSAKTNLIDSIAAQSCIEIGYTDHMVQKAIDIYTNKYGKNDFKGKDLCEILFELEENPEAIDTYKEDQSQIAQVDSDTLNEDIEPLETLVEENQRLKENQMCKICLDSRADIIFLPCGHMVSCPQCAPALTKCPVCRKTVNGHIKAFFATTSIS